MKTYFVCVQAGNEGIKVKADWVMWDTDELSFLLGPIRDEENSRIIGAFKTWKYWFEVQE